ncbi:hypothetical protein DM784_01540 [Vibrio furnissii]|nr:hypothetical protein DM784_01540 [Vibrio furnissii]
MLMRLNVIFIAALQHPAWFYFQYIFLDRFISVLIYCRIDIAVISIDINTLLITRPLNKIDIIFDLKSIIKIISNIYTALLLQRMKGQPYSHENSFDSHQQTYSK